MIIFYKLNVFPVSLLNSKKNSRIDMRTITSFLSLIQNMYVRSKPKVVSRCVFSGMTRKDFLAMQEWKRRISSIY
jgi:hypothetical protein